MLTAPGGGQQLEFLGATGDGDDPMAGVNVTVWDGASGLAPFIGSGTDYSWPNTGSLSVKPSSYFNAPLNGISGGPPLPAGGGSAQWATTDGDGTFSNVFGGGAATPNGGWILSLRDDNPDTEGDPVSVTSWSLVMTVVASAKADTTTTISSSSTNNTSFTGGANSSVTLTATVTSTSTVDAGTVTFKDGGTDLACSPVAVSSGTAHCTTTLTTEGIHTLSASYSGSSDFNLSNSGTLNQFVKNHSTLSGGEYCNTDAVTVDGGVITPYPSVVNVGTDTTALTGTVADLSITLKGLSASAGLFPGYGFMLVAPDGGTHNLDFLSSVGTSGSQSAINLTIADDNPSGPVDGPLSTTTYGPTDVSNSADAFVQATSPAPQVPGTINYAQPDFFGSNPLTLSQAFSGVDPNGDWTLYGYNNGGDSLAVTGGWCLAFTVNSGAATTTTLTALSPAFTGNPVTITATVTSGGNPVSGGTVTFTENGAAPAGVSNNVATVNGSGQASITTSSLAEGDHDIVATYSGVSNTYGTSSDSRWYRENTATTATASGASATFCNPGGFTLPNQAESADNIGAAAPNPSNIFVANLPGTISKVSLELEDFQTNPLSDTIYYTSSLLVGPGAATANTLDFFSGTGTTDNETELAKGNYIFADSGSELVPQADFGPGTYLPTSYDTSGIKGTYTASPSGFYTLPGSFNYAATRGSSTFDSVYGNADANGTWSLYFYQNFSVVTTQATATGWCLDFTENQPSASVTASHNGSGFHGEFAQGETNADISVAITNNGPGPTGDPTADTNPMTVTDDLNAAFTYSTFSGTGWSCSASGQTVTCTNDSAIAQGSSYPELTIDVNVSASAGTPINNSVSVSGAGVASTSSNTDSIAIQPAPLLSVTKTHPGTFNAGQTAEWDITVSNAATSSSTSGAVTVYDALPMGYTLSSYAGTGWSCSGTTTATCMSSQGVGGGASFDTLALTVDVPTNSPSSVSNTALAWGGGSLTQTNSGNAASGSDLDVTVLPATVNVTIGTSPAGLGFSIGGVGYTTTQTPALTVGTPYALLTTTPQAGATGVQYVFSGWSDGTLTTADTLTPTLSTTSDTAEFTTQYFLTVSAGTGGTIAVTTAPNAFYNAGTAQTIAATPSAGYYFTGWTGANSPSDIASATSASTTVTMNGPENITANFAPIPGYIVSTTADDATGVAANCPASPSTGSACSLRDALAAAAATGAGNITFDATAFATAQTITLANGVLNIPSATTIAGATTGSGASLVNLVTVDGNGASEVFTVSSGVTGASIANLTIQHGNNSGILNGGTLTLTGDSITSNTRPVGLGGGIFNFGSLTLTSSTISGNTASDSAGGGIANEGTLTMSDDTVTGNSAATDGGGIYNTATLVVSDCTLSANTAGYPPGGGGIENTGTVALANSILSGNTNPASDDFHGNAYTNSGGNIVGVANGATVNGTAINLAPLANYGGPTQTLIPLPGSPAICAGLASAIPSGLTTDQRGYPNTNSTYPSYAACVDAGAVQTNYSLGFTTEPTGVSVATDFAAAVTLNESLSPFQPGVTIPLTLTGSGILTGGSAATSAGVASYTLQVDTAGSSDTLTANLTLNGALDPAVAISATSNSFGVGMTTPLVGLDYSTSGSIAYGTPETFYAYLPPGATGTVTFYNGSTALGSGSLISGTATFSSSTLATGSYSITAYYPGDSNYNSNTSSALSLTVYPSPATMASPTPSGALTSAATTFTWNAASGSVTGYGLNVGTTGVGSADLVNIGPLPLSPTSVTVNLPTNGTMIYVRLWTIFNGTTYLYNDYTYTEFTQSPAAITSPAPGSALTTAATTFAWSPGPVGTTSYSLNVGTTGVGSADLVNIGPLPLSPTSVTVNLPTNGTKIYVRLWTILNGTTYLANDYTYTEFTQSASAITSPSPGSILTSASTTFAWNPGPAGTTSYSLNVGTTGVGSADLVNIGPLPLSPTSVTVNLPTNGTLIYVRLWTILNGTTYLANDYTYTEFTQSPAAITSPMPGSILTSAATTFTWNPGPAGTTSYGLNVGTTGVGSADLVNIAPLPLSPTSVTVNLPTNGTTIYVRLWTILNGTTYLSKDYTYTEFTQSPAAITSPMLGSVLTSASTTFTWNPGPVGTTGYGLNVGTSPGGADLVNIGPLPLSPTSVTVNLPTNGTLIYVRLWTILSGPTYLENDYNYTEFTQ
jgi:uncharacterized repeat protein (TIGR02543 family)